MPSSSLSEPWRDSIPTYYGSDDIEVTKMVDSTVGIDVLEYRKAEGSASMPNKMTLASHSTSFLDSWRPRKRRKRRRDYTDDSTISDGSQGSTMSSASTRSSTSTASSASSRDFDLPTTPSSTDFAFSVDSNLTSMELDQTSSDFFGFNYPPVDMRLQKAEFNAHISDETFLASYSTSFLESNCQRKRCKRGRDQSDNSALSSACSRDFDPPTTPSSTVDFAYSLDSNLTLMELDQTNSDFFDFNDLGVDMGLLETEFNTPMPNETSLASYSTSFLTANCQEKCCKLCRDRSDYSAMISASFQDFDQPTLSSTTSSACLMDLNSATMELDQTSSAFSSIWGSNYFPVGTSIESSHRESMFGTNTCSAGNFFGDIRPRTTLKPMVNGRGLFRSLPTHAMGYPMPAKQIEATGEAQDYYCYPTAALESDPIYKNGLEYVADVALPVPTFPSYIPSPTKFNYTPFGTLSTIHKPWPHIPLNHDFYRLQDPQHYEPHHDSQQLVRYLSPPPALSGNMESQAIQDAFEEPSMAGNCQNGNIRETVLMLQPTASNDTAGSHTEASKAQLIASNEEADNLGVNTTFTDDTSWGSNRSLCDIVEYTQQSMLKQQRNQRPARGRRLWCQIGNCRSFPPWFNTSAERYLHYETFHSHLLLKCADSSCSYATTGFLRNSDRMRHYKSKHTLLYRKLRGAPKTQSGSIAVLDDARIESDLETSAVSDASSQNGLQESRIPTMTTDNLPDTSAEAPEKVLDSPESTSTSNTDPSTESTMSPSSPMMETDWENDSISGDGAYYVLSDPSHGVLHEGGDQTYSNKIALPNSKQASVNRIMDEFYIIFNQEWTASLKNATGPSTTASSPFESRSSGSSVKRDSSSGQSQKRRRGDDGSSPHDDDENNPKRPKPSSPPSDTPSSCFQFACPYYKHDPEKYGLNHESSNPAYRSCALKKFASIARMKAHLYKSHKVPMQCKRCWLPFQDQLRLDAHMTVDSAKICDVSEPRPLEGITPEVEQRVRCRKKSYPGQSEGGIWRDIFRILFPGETVPSPLHDPIQYNTAASPDSRAVANYEEFRAQQLPVLFQSRVEAIIAQPGRSEESIMRHLTDMILDCSGELYSLYSSRLQTASDSPSVMSMPETGEGNPSPALIVSELGCSEATLVQGSFESGTLPSTSHSSRLHQSAMEACSAFQGAQTITEIPLNKDDDLVAAQTQVDVIPSNSIGIQEPLLRPVSGHGSLMTAEMESAAPRVYGIDRLARFHQQLPPQDSANLGPDLSEVLQQTGRLPKSPTQQDFSDSGYGSYPADILNVGGPQSQGSKQDTNSDDFSFEKMMDGNSFTGDDQSFFLDSYLNL